MARILPARERALRALQAQLETITVANGYAVNVKHVRRLRKIIERADDPPEIHILPTKSENSFRGVGSGNEMWTELPITLLFHAGAESEAPDTEYNFLLADIQRALSGDVTDTSGVAGGGQAVVIEVESTSGDVPVYWDRTTTEYVIGRLDYVLRFSWCLEDPRLFNRDDVHVLE